VFVDQYKSNCIARSFITCTFHPVIIIMNKSRRMRWAGHLARMGGRGMHVEYWWEIQKERPLGRPRLRLVDNIKMNLREIG
jgi:hypothetical protein